jgi:glycosyltransferase involved in cell wall biosynthesis
MPILRASGRPIDFVIAGSKPTKSVTALAAQPDITVTGRVEDMRPYLAHADIAVAPLHLARGVQNKVLEAMAAATPAVVTQAALDGIDHDSSVTVASTGAEFANAITSLLDDPARAASLGGKAQAVIADQYSWAARIEALERVIAGDDSTANRSAA